MFTEIYTLEQLQGMTEFKVESTSSSEDYQIMLSYDFIDLKNITASYFTSKVDLFWNSR